ncbi:MAG: lipid A export permease/ATP-binding protein MsbA [Gammaproteobacteria bacterium]
MNSKRLYFRLLGYVRPHARVFVAAILGTILLAATEPALPALVKPLLDGSFVAKDPFYIAWMPVFIVAVFIVRGVAGFISEVAMRWVATRVVMDLRKDMFARLLVLPDQRFADTASGVMLSRFTYNANEVMNASTRCLVTLVRDSLAVLGLVSWTLYLNWRLALITLLVAPAVAIVVRLISRRLRRLSRGLQDTMGVLNQVIDEVLQGHRVIKIFGGEEYEARRFHDANNWVRRYNMKLAVASEASVPAVQLMAVIALAIMVALASKQAASGALTVGAFVSLFGAMAMLLAPIKRLTKLNEELQRGLAAAESVFALIDETPEPDRGARRLPQVRGQVTLQGVGFRYPGSAAPVLSQIDLEVAPGETVAIVGASGSGKTSLVNLLARFYECGRGRILLDGADITELTLADLRAQMAYVGQQVVLFNDSIAANIAYGARRAASEAEIAAAAASAHALEFIRELPQGFATLIGENGVKLSGGQRQRIAIARALLKNAPILILDEATSALDAQSERKVQEALERLRQGRTAFVVAHRLSTIETADRIVVLERGRIVEIGNHRELLARNGVYAGLYWLQERELRDKAALIG